MGLKDALKDTIDNIGDAASEAGHRVNADGERAKREIAGNELTPGEKVASVANEGKERVLAAVDKTKRDVRSNT